MSLIIDGHNLIGAMPDIDLSDPDDELQLVQRLRAYCVGRRHLTVVFDSGPSPSPQWDLSGGCVTVRFAPPGTEADAVILDMLRRSPQPGQVTVVTNDRLLADLARASGGQIRSATQFAGLLSSKARPEEPPDERGHDPKAPAFRDIYEGFVTADKDSARFGAEIDLNSQVWIERLYGDDPAEAARAAHWLGRFGGAAALEPLLDALTHTAAVVRAAACLALADAGDTPAARALADRLEHDGSSMVREAAARALARLGGPTAEAALLAARFDTKRKVRRAAEEGLDQVRGRRGRA